MSSGHQRIKWRRNIAENFNRLSRVHEHYRQTTDRRTTAYSEHEHEFTFAKNILAYFFLAHGVYQSPTMHMHMQYYAQSLSDMSHLQLQVSMGKTSQRISTVKMTSFLSEDTSMVKFL